MLTKIKQGAWEAFVKRGLPKDVTLSTEVKAPAVVRAAFPKACIALPLEQAVRAYGALLERAWRKTLTDGCDSLSLLNLARFQGGLFVYVPPQVCIEEVVELEHAGDFARVHLFLGEGAALTLSLKSNGGGHLLVEGECGPHARLTLFRPQGGIDTLRFSLKKEARLEVVSACEGEGHYFQDVRCRLTEVGAHAEVHSLAKLSASGRMRTEIRMEHLAEKTTSEQRVKSLLDGRSRSFFEGAIVIAPVAQLSEAHQLARALALSKGVQAHARPILSIGADDVQATHGSTISQLDERALFYLQSRGLSNAQAKELLVSGFCHEILKRFRGCHE